jgi:hypothetical protein
MIEEELAMDAQQGRITHRIRKSQFDGEKRQFTYRFHQGSNTLKHLYSLTI